MSVSFSGNNLINLAIGIERKGIAFYDVLARSTENDAARAIFQHLVEMERNHIQIFQDMLSEADKLAVSEARTEEDNTYLQTLVDSAVFSDDLLTSEMVIRVDSNIKAMELAISAEKDAILFYYEMRDMMAEPARPAINKVLAEEKLHLSQLSELKNKLSSV